MEPFILEQLAGLAAGQAVAHIKKRHARRQIAKQVVKSARRKDIQITVKGVSGWLRRPDAGELLGGTPPGPSNASATHHLAWLIGGPARLSDAEKLRGIILVEVLKAVAGEGAAVLYQQTAHEAAATRATINTQARLDASFAANCGLLHPWRSSTAQSLRPSWPNVIRVVDTIVKSQTPGETLRDWRSTQPSLIQGLSAASYAWLAAMADDFGEPSTAAYYYERAIEEGATPSAYFLAKAAGALATTDEPSALAYIDRTVTHHPLSAMYRHIRAPRLQDALSEIQSWQTESEEDACLRAMWEAELLGRLGHNDRKRKVLDSVVEAHSNCPDSGVALSVHLVEQVRMRASLTPHEDLKTAHALAISARDKRRSWRFTSDGPTLAAARAIAETGDLQTAVRLLTSQPDGEATPAEANRARTLEERALLLAAQAGTIEQAQAAIRQVADKAVADMIDGVLDLRRDNVEAGAEKLHRAYAAEPRLAEKYRIARLIAEASASLPDLTAIEDGHPTEAAHLRLVQRVMVPDEGRPNRLLRYVNDDPIFALTLAELHSNQGRYLEASELLESIGQESMRPTMLDHAAQERRKAGDNNNAIRLWQAALTMAGDEWFAEAATRGRMCETLFLDGAYDEALGQAVRLVALEPSNASARWALVRILIQLAQPAKAWSAVTDGPVVLEPRDADEAVTWARLAASGLQATDNVANVCLTLSAIARTWSDDRTSPDLVLSLTTTCDKPFVDEEAGAAMAKAAQELLERHAGPDSTLMRQISIGPDEDPLRNITPTLKARYDHFAALQQQISEGKIPVGMATLATGSATRAILDRSAGKIYGYEGDGADVRAETAARALGGRCVIDLTALATLTYLDRPSADDLFTSFNGLLSTTDVIKDVVYSQPGELDRGRLSLSWDPVAGQARVHHASDGDIAQQRERLSALERFARRTRAHRVGKLTNFPKIDDPSSGSRVWLGALELAATQSLPLWCDDLVLARLGKDVGVEVFSTVDLVRTLDTQDKISHDLAVVTEARLMHEYYVDLGFQRDVTLHAAELASWGMGGAAFSLTRASTWRNDSESAYDFLRLALTRTADNPFLIQGWVASAGMGLAAVAGAEHHQASANLVVLLERLLLNSSARGEQVPFILAGIREPLRHNEELEDPLEKALRQIFAKLVTRIAHAEARDILSATLSQASDADKGVLTRVVITAS